MQANLDFEYDKFDFSSAWKRIYKPLQKLMDLFFYLKKKSEKLTVSTDTDDEEERGHRGK